MNKLTVKDIDLKAKRVLMRVDFNVPLDKQGNITDDRRIRAARPTIKYCLDRGAGKVILISHLGRPKGKVAEAFRLTPVGIRLEELLGEGVRKLDDCLGEDVGRAIGEAGERVVLLENLRFHPEEEKNDREFARQLAGLADVFVNDAFGAAHRAHASCEAVTHFLPAVAGLLLAKEMEYLGRILACPDRPFVLILGGAKVSDKILLIENMLDKVDEIIIGGGMCYTFLKARGLAIGASKLDAERVGVADEILRKARGKAVNISLPVDNLVVDKVERPEKIETVEGDIAAGFMGVDIGPRTVDNFCRSLSKARTVLWNGPLGIFEVAEFSQGSFRVAEFVAGLEATKVIGGGDTAAMIACFGLEDKMSHISTGGGACLEYLEGKALPGIAALSAA
ncbi:MAG: phosphoglycerate kinase [Candidatus Omnitrophota bacterium]